MFMIYDMYLKFLLWLDMTSIEIGYWWQILFIHNPDILRLIPSTGHQYVPLTFRHVHRIEKSDYKSRHVCPSVCPTT